MTAEELRKLDMIAWRWFEKRWDECSLEEIDQLVRWSELDEDVTAAYAAWLRPRAALYDDIVDNGAAAVEVHANGAKS